MRCMNCETVAKSATTTHCGKCGASMLIHQTVPAPLKTTLLPLQDTPPVDSRAPSGPSVGRRRSPARATQWNWAAFVLNAVWYLLHGMWLKGLVILAAEVYFGYPAVLLAALYCGYHATRDLEAAGAAQASAHHPTH